MTEIRSQIQLLVPCLCSNTTSTVFVRQEMGTRTRHVCSRQSGSKLLPLPSLPPLSFDVAVQLVQVAPLEHVRQHLQDALGARIERTMSEHPREDPAALHAAVRVVPKQDVRVPCPRAPDGELCHALHRARTGAAKVASCMRAERMSTRAAKEGRRRWGSAAEWPDTGEQGPDLDVRAWQLNA